MKDCIFCKIIDGSIPSKKIYEDDIVKVIMNINPEQNGDLLVVLKEHKENYTCINDVEATHINRILKEMDLLLHEKLDISGMSIITNAGSCQEIKHFHIHITPGYVTEQPIVDLDIIYDKLKGTKN